VAQLLPVPLGATEARVNAAAECGGAANVHEIRTRRSFNQGLVAAFASSSGVNVYSPWTGEVICADAPEGACTVDLAVHSMEPGEASPD
jgi:hypothetical protein